MPRAGGFAERRGVLAGSVYAQGLQGWPCIEGGVGDQSLFGAARQHLELLAQRDRIEAARCQLLRARRDAPQAGLHPKRRRDGGKVERHAPGAHAAIFEDR